MIRPDDREPMNDATDTTRSNSRECPDRLANDDAHDEDQSDLDTEEESVLQQHTQHPEQEPPRRCLSEPPDSFSLCGFVSVVLIPGLV